MKLLNNVLSFLFPARDEATLIDRMTPVTMGARLKTTSFDSCIALAPYKDPIVRAAIHELKFHNNEHAALILGALLALWLQGNIHEETLLIPIPLSYTRFRERGYNQVTRIAKHGCSAFPYITLAPRVLKRIRNTKPQTSLERQARLQNLTGAFAVRAGWQKPLAGARIVLLDDVYTTGATMNAARAALLEHRPASVMCVAVAH